MDALPPPAHSASPLRRWLPLAVLAGVAALIVATGAHRWLSFETIIIHKASIERFIDNHALAALAIYMAIYISVTALSIPGALIMTVAGGLLFDFWTASLAILVSATIGATLLFLVASSALGETLRAKGGDTVKRMTEGLRADAASYLLFLRLVPLFPFALVNIAPAIVGVPIRTFVWTTMVGIMPGTLAFTLAANSFDSVLDDRMAAFEACKTMGRADCVFSVDLSTLVSTKLLLAFAALGFIALIPVIAKRVFSGTKGVPLA